LQGIVGNTKEYNDSNESLGFNLVGMMKDLDADINRSN